MYLLYRIATAIGAILLAPCYAIRARRRGDPAHRVRERLGLLPEHIRAAAAASRPIWVHAVSVGEVLAAQPLVKELKQQRPDRAIVVSTTTETGQALAQERLGQLAAIFYFPFDSTAAVRRALRTLRPAVVVVMETEIWPNFLWEARRAQAPVIFANARISDRSFARFVRWRFAIDQFFKQALQSAALFLAQSEQDAKRLMEMGADGERVEVTGNLKYDQGAPPVGEFAEWLVKQIRGQERWPVVVAGSVLEQEEEAVLAAYDVVQRKFRRALLVLAPRKPDRFAGAADAAAKVGWTTIKRSALDLGGALPEDADVLVLDSIGELGGVYSLADAAFVGGSLTPAGGHNILEPACFSKPPIFGPSMENFSEMAAQFLDAQAAVQVASGPQLGKVWLQLVDNPELNQRMGQAALEIATRNRGATQKTVERILATLDGSGAAR